MRVWVKQRLSDTLDALHPRLAESLSLARHAREYAVPNPPSRRDEQTNMPATRLDPPGIDLRQAAQLEWLEGLRSDAHRDLFRALRADPAINRLGHGSERVSNIFCNTPDAEIYASMILERRPRRIVEVGSGYSTLIARRAIAAAGLDTALVATDPHPRTDVAAVTDELRQRRVEETDLLGERWSPGDILFIDSSHICRTRGDLPYLFCRVIPALPPGVRVHVHDIFLPYDYPNLYDPWWHTEQYLLSCLLSHTPRYRVVVATHWLSRTHPDRMNRVFGPYAGSGLSSPDHFGCSFWFDVVDDRGPA